MNKLIIWISLIPIILLLIDYSLAMGWIVGIFATVLRRGVRYRYLNHLSDTKKFGITQYILYTLLSYGLAISIIALAVYFRNVINPYVVLIVFFLDYIYLHIQQVKDK